jgi:hypothetical protein
MAMQCGSQRRRAVYVHQWACVAPQIKRCLDVCQSRHGDVCVPWACDARRIEKAFVRPEKSGVCVPWCISPASCVGRHVGVGVSRGALPHCLPGGGAHGAAMCGWLDCLHGEDGRCRRSHGHHKEEDDCNGTGVTAWSACATVMLSPTTVKNVVSRMDSFDDAA